MDPARNFFDMLFITRVKSKVYKISEKLVHHGLRYDVSGGTFEGKKDQPKFQTRAVLISGLVCSLNRCVRKIDTEDHADMFSIYTFTSS